MLEPASTETIRTLWEELWGLPIDTPDREYMPDDVEGLVLKDQSGSTLALVTWAIEGERAEIVSVNALRPGSGVGNRAMDAAEEELRRRGVRNVHLITTNDNVRALAFYQRRGYRLVRLHLGGMDRVRAAKPEVPLVGNDGIPLRDMWELQKEL